MAICNKGTWWRNLHNASCDSTNQLAHLRGSKATCSRHKIRRTLNRLPYDKLYAAQDARHEWEGILVCWQMPLSRRSPLPELNARGQLLIIKSFAS
jgi:hypothetical protein